jgi:hypothetical protein
VTVLSRLTVLLDAFHSTPRRLIGAALLRVFVGVACVDFYIANIHLRDYLWGPNSYASFDDFRKFIHPSRPSLYALNASHGWFTFCFLAGLVVAVLFTVLGGRTLAVLHAVFMLSLYARNDHILDGGDNFISIAVLFLPLMVTNAYFTPTARWRRARLESSAASSWSPLRNVVHNGAVAAVVVEACAVYAVAGLWKVGSVNWRNGDALYFISRVGEFHFAGWFAALMGNPFLVAMATYGVVGVQLAFAPLVLGRRRAHLAILGVAAMHIGIITTMGLVSFGIAMLGADSVCMGDKQYARAFARLARLIRRPAVPPSTKSETHNRRSPRKEVMRTLADMNMAMARGAAAAAVLAFTVGALGRRSDNFPAPVRTFATVILALAGVAFAVTGVAVLLVSDGG